MATEQAHKRKATYRLYPTPSQETVLREQLRSHQQLYNAALEERIGAWRAAGKSISYADQCRGLTEARAALPDLAAVNCSSQQMTLRRLDKAFAAFFRRIKAGEAPGFPRFKSLERFPGFSFKSHGDGWRFTPGPRWQHGRLRLSGVGHIPARGKARTGGEIRASEILHRQGQWFLSLTVEPVTIARARVADQAFGLDWGVESLAMLALPDGSCERVANPRLGRGNREQLEQLQQALSRKRRGSRRRRQAVRRLASFRAREARVRLDSLHQLTARLASRCALVATEDLAIKNLTRSAKGSVESPGRNVRQKAGLNREILDTAPALFLQLLRYKVLETGGVWAEAPTRKLKPSQRCPACGALAKKSLAERLHRCPCGHTEPRDAAAARVMLNWALTGEPCAPSGTGQELAETRLTPA